MKKFTITICAAIILAGCTSNSSLLSKKQECFNYKDALEEEYRDSDYVGSDFSMDTTVIKIFYSPKQDSCLYVGEISESRYDQPGGNGSIQEFFLFDYLTGEEIYYAKGCDGELLCGSTIQEAKNDFEAELKNYE